MRIITSSHENAELIYQQTPIFGNSKILSYPHDVTAERVTVKDFAQLFGIKKEEIEVEDSLSWNRFNFRMKSHNRQKITAEEVKIILEKEKLIKD